MKIITAFFRDGSSRVLATVNDDFDTTAWLNEPETMLRLLVEPVDVVKVEEQIYKQHEE